MKALLSIVTLVLFSSAHAENLAGKYELKNSKIDYLVKYLIKKADGNSEKAQGKGECGAEICEFLVAAPIKSFESKDSNRDLNMLKVTKADKFPLVVAKIRTRKEISNGQILADMEVDFVGVKMKYLKLPLKVTPTADGFHAEGKFDLLLDNHKVEKPSLLGVDIENAVPITLNADWKKI